MSNYMSKIHDTPNTIRCTRCNAFASWEKTEKSEPPEGEVCIICDAWVCKNCIDWTYMSQKETENIICVKCSENEDQEDQIGDNRKVAYICGQCLTPFPRDVSDDAGNCLRCSADYWLGERDFGIACLNQYYVGEICKKHDVDEKHLKSMFRWECIGMSDSYSTIVFRDPANHSQHSFPLKSKQGGKIKINIEEIFELYDRLKIINNFDLRSSGYNGKYYDKYYGK